jgi:CRP/FNR family transcriptional regulator, cyclic AMP receptor protein
MADDVARWLERYLERVVERSPALENLRGEAKARLPLEQVARYFEARTLQPGEVLLAQSAEPNRLYLIVEGSALVYEQPVAGGRVGDPQPINELGPCDVVGEVGVVMRMPRIATVTAASRLEVLATGHGRLGKLVQADPVLGTALLRWFAQNAVVKIRTTRWFDEAFPLAAPMDETPTIHDGPQPVIESAAVPLALAPDDVRRRLASLTCFRWRDGLLDDDVARFFHAVRVPAGAPVVRDGEHGDSLLLLTTGTAMVHDRRGQPVAAFSAGHERCVHVMLGEMSYLIPGPRTGTVTATTDCELLETSRAQLQALLDAHPKLAVLLHIRILQVICRKLVETAAASAHYGALLGEQWRHEFAEDDRFVERRTVT